MLGFLLSGVGRKAVMAGLVLAMAGGTVLWLRKDAADKREAEIRAATDKARIEAIQRDKDSDDEIDNDTHAADDLRRRAAEWVRQ